MSNVSNRDRTPSVSRYNFPNFPNSPNFGKRKLVDKNGYEIRDISFVCDRCPRHRDGIRPALVCVLVAGRFVSYLSVVSNPDPEPKLIRRSALVQPCTAPPLNGTASIHPPTHPLIVVVQLEQSEGIRFRAILSSTSTAVLLLYCRTITPPTRLPLPPTNNTNTNTTEHTNNATNVTTNTALPPTLTPLPPPPTFSPSPPPPPPPPPPPTPTTSTNAVRYQVLMVLRVPPGSP